MQNGRTKKRATHPDRYRRTTPPADTSDLSSDASDGRSCSRPPQRSFGNIAPRSLRPGADTQVAALRDGRAPSFKSALAPSRQRGPWATRRSASSSSSHPYSFCAGSEYFLLENMSTGNYVGTPIPIPPIGTANCALQRYARNHSCSSITFAAFHLVAAVRFATAECQWLLIRRHQRHAHGDAIRFVNGRAFSRISRRRSLSSLKQGHSRIGDPRKIIFCIA